MRWPDPKILPIFWTNNPDFRESVGLPAEPERGSWRLSNPAALNALLAELAIHGKTHLHVRREDGAHRMCVRVWNCRDNSGCSSWVAHCNEGPCERLIQALKAKGIPAKPHWHHGPGWVLVTDPSPLGWHPEYVARNGKR